MLRETDLTAQQKETPFPALDRQTLKQNAACGFIDWVSAAALGQQGGSRPRHGLKRCFCKSLMTLGGGVDLIPEQVALTPARRVAGLCDLDKAEGCRIRSRPLDHGPDIQA